MKVRNLPRLGLVAVMGLVLSGAPTLVAAHASAPQAIQWKNGPASPFAGTRFDGQYYSANKRVYFLGFRAGDDTTDGSIWYFDVATRTYVDTTKDMPVPVSNYQIAALSDSHGLGLYIFGGRDAAATIVTTVQVYYPATNQTLVINSDPWPGTTPSGCTSLPAMGVAAVSGRAVVMGGVAFTANGCVADENSAQTWVFDPNAAAGSRWSAGPNLNVARGYITPATLGGKVFAIGGDINTAGSLFAQPTVESWTFGSGSWNDGAVADLPQGCDESQAWGFLDGPLARKIVLGGCGQWPNDLPDTWQYDAVANTWTLVGNLLHSRRNQAGALIQIGSVSMMYVLGGYGADGVTVETTSEVAKPTAAGPARPSGLAPNAADRSATTS